MSKPFFPFLNTRLCRLCPWKKNSTPLRRHAPVPWSLNLAFSYEPAFENIGPYLIC